VTEPTTDGSTGGILRDSNGIAAARTLIALEANATALQHRLPDGWELFQFADALSAFRYYKAGKAFGKIVISQV
jgi:hypothetical protein